MNFLDFEKPIAELEGKIAELRHGLGEDGINVAEEVSRLQLKADRRLRDVYAKLTPWQKTQVARHPDRPHCLDYVAALIEDFQPRLRGRSRRYRRVGSLQGAVGGGNRA